MRSSAKDGQMRSWPISSQQSNMLLFRLMDRKCGNIEDSSKFSFAWSLQSWSRKGTQHGLVFPSPEHEAIDEESALPLDDGKELPDILVPCRNTTNSLAFRMGSRVWCDITIRDNNDEVIYFLPSSLILYLPVLFGLLENSILKSTRDSRIKPKKSMTEILMIAIAGGRDFQLDFHQNVKLLFSEKFHWLFFHYLLLQPKFQSD